MRYLFFTLLISSFIVISCSPNKRNKLVEEIKKMEKNGDEYNPKYLDSLNILYEKFVTNYPKDSLASMYLLYAAKSSYSRGTQDEKYLDQAIVKLNSLVSNYSESKEVETAIFLLGSIYENNKSDTIKAKEYYTLYIHKYPTGEYAESVKTILAGNLGKSAEEWIKKFQMEGKIDTSVHVK